ncbi:MAG: ligand-binding sensor domain-containing protein [Ginsengibacter sp.]
MKNTLDRTQKRLLFVIAILCAHFSLQAQPLKQFSSRGFTVNEGLLANRVVDIAEDNAGFVWLSYGAGLQRYNGNEFEVVRPREGLPETNHPHFFKLQDGSLWLSYNSGISAYNSFTNKFHIVFRTPESELEKIHQPEPYKVSPVMPVFESGNEVWCWWGGKHKFIAINKLTHKVQDAFNIEGRLPGTKYFKKGSNGTLLVSFDDGIAEIDFRKKKIQRLCHVPGIKNLVYDYLPLDEDTVLLATNKGIFKADLKSGFTELLSTFPVNVETDNIACITMRTLFNDRIVVAVNNQLYIFNSHTSRFLYRMVNRKNQDFFNLGYITSCMPDRFHNLWLLSFSGLRKISFGTFNIKYFGVADMRKNFSRCIFPDKSANLVITGSLLNQLSVFDTSGHLLKQFTISPDIPSKEVSCILKAGINKYMIFADGKYSVYLLNTATMQLAPIKRSMASAFYPLNIMGDTAAILAEPTGVVRAVYSPKKIRFKPLVKTKFLCALLDNKGRLWIGGAGKYSVLSGKNFTEKSVFYLKENVITKCIFQDSEKNIWLGTEEGLYKINPLDGAVLRIYGIRDGLADENVYSVQEDDDKNIWCSTNKGLSCIYRDGHIVNLYASDGLQGNEFNTNVSAKAKNGELFFGGTNGVNSFYPAEIKVAHDNPLVVMQHINVMDEKWKTDTAAWCIYRIRLPYSKNVISFDFIALGRYEPDVYEYRYKMKGMDHNWVNTGSTGHARYALPPGNYTFEYAAGLTGESSDTIKYITVIITPLFWQTAWFKIIVVIVAAIMLWAIMYLYNKRRYEKKLQQLKMQQSIQRERQRISRDLHDNVGAYTTALAAGTEELNGKAISEDVKQTAQNISANAKNIIASLQETIWVLNNDTIKLTDFSDRLKMYSKKIMHHNIMVHIRFHESIDNDPELSPGEALNIFRVMQEALHNALRHSRASLISIDIMSGGGSVLICLKDNGNGFDVTRESLGNGLDNMRYRCMEAGYDLNIHSGLEGTSITLKKNHSFAV